MLTCVNICQATTTIFTDWSGMYRPNCSTIPCPMTPVLPDMTYDNTAAATRRVTTPSTAASATPPALSEHLLQINPGSEVYPWLQIEQSVQQDETGSGTGESIAVTMREAGRRGPFG